MGTNFYVIRPGCTHCNREFEAIHVGKSSSGLHGYNKTYPMTGDYEMRATLTTAKDWAVFMDEMKRVGWSLRDEYGEECTDSVAVLSRIVRSERQHLANKRHFYDFRPTVYSEAHQSYIGVPLDAYSWVDAEGYTFSTWEWS